MSVKISDKNSLEKILIKYARLGIESAQSAINEDTQEELRRQYDLSARLAATAGKSDPSPKNEAEDEEASDDQKEEEPKTNNRIEIPETIKFGNVRNVLNTIRAGRSLKDEEIKSELKKYFDDLDEGEQVALYSYLAAIADIITMGIDNEYVREPSDSPYNVEMEKSGKVKASKEKGEAPKKVKLKPAKKSAEDTAPPIQVGKEQTTEGILRRLRALTNS